MDVISISCPPTIASHGTKCTEAFSQLCASLRSSDVPFLDQIEEGEVQDEFGRLRVWAGNMCAYKLGDTSLDNRLRDAVHLHNKSSDSLRISTTIYMKVSNPCTTSKREPNDSSLIFLSLYDIIGPEAALRRATFYSDLSSSTSSNDNLDARIELQQIFSNLTEIIDSLYDLSVIIRTLAPRGQTRVKASISLPEVKAQE